jgi:acetoacetyl-CoA synthetase
VAHINEGTLLWEPSPRRQAHSNITQFAAWLERTRGRSFADYEALWRWSTTDLDGFWGAVWDYFNLGPRTGPVLAVDRMPGAVWFPDVRLNYAERVFERRRGAALALVVEAEGRPASVWTWDDLADQVARAASGLRRLGVRPGDRVVGFLPNIPEAVVAFLATASLGAVWSSCSPDFGEAAVLDRFRQVDPVVLIGVDGYQYGGRVYDRRPLLQQLARRLPTLKATVWVPYRFEEPEGLPAEFLTWSALTREAEPLVFEPVPFAHPLWILYSSGTTGLPKPIVQGHGGILLVQLLQGSVHTDLGEESRFFWFTTTGWMMWNTLVGGLLGGSTIVLYDGHPAFPEPDRLFRLAEQHRVTFFGTSAAFLAASEKAGIRPRDRWNLDALESVGSTGSPLAPAQFAWVYEAVKPDVWLTSASGGTDLCAKLVGGVPTLPVHAGELQCRCLGMAVEAFDEEGKPVVDRIGELVITRPSPSMPIYFWNDPDGRRYRESYFERYPGVWRHGDWIKITARGSAVIYGRSDATINRHGVRMGSAEIYRVVEALPDVVDSLVVDLEYRDRPSTLCLFVVLREGVRLDDALTGSIREAIRRQLSPRHVPDVIHQIAAVPRTLNGKKLEIPVRKILLGVDPDEAVNRGAVANPAALDELVAWAAGQRPATTLPSTPSTSSTPSTTGQDA